MNPKSTAWTHSPERTSDFRRILASLCFLLLMAGRSVAALPAVSVLWELPEGNPVGVSVTFATVITNAGPGTITQIHFTNSIPPQLTNVTVTVSQGTFAVSNAAVRSELGSLAEGVSATVSFTGQPAGPGFANVDYEFQGRSEGNTFLHDYGQLAVRFGVADIAVSLTLLTNVLQAGVPYEAVITVTNLEPDLTREVVLLFLPSDGQEILSLHTPAGIHTPVPGGWQVINLGPLPAHGAVTVEATLLPVRAGALHLSAQTQQEEFDLNDENNYALLEFFAQDGAGVIQFDLAEQIVSERAGQVAIHIHRREGAKGTVAVSYTVQDLTAFVGTHHAGTNGLLTFAPGETEQTLIIPILQDSRPECSREFRLSLHDATGGALVRNITNVTVTILDDDVLPTGSLETVSVSSNRAGYGQQFLSLRGADTGWSLGRVCQLCQQPRREHQSTSPANLSARPRARNHPPDRTVAVQQRRSRDGSLCHTPRAQCGRALRRLHRRRRWLGHERAAAGG